MVIKAARFDGSRFQYGPLLESINTFGALKPEQEKRSSREYITW